MPFDPHSISSDRATALARPAVSRRRLPVGADVVEGGVHFRVWAPRARRVAVVLDRGDEHELGREAGGYFAALVDSIGAGARYRYRLDDGAPLYPDPASRFQPDGPHGSSEVVDPARYRWGDERWRGVDVAGQVIYEMHVGTFTRAGTWAAAIDELPALADVGVTVLEVMPVAEFPGRFGWGYDGVDLFAPTRLYGEPDDFRRFVDTAHAQGLGVILDVVYNHLGPDGNYLPAFAPEYFTERYPNEWGDAINFDGEDAGPVREFFVANAGYWVDEFHVDGLRLDATQQIFDRSAEHIVAAVARRVREAARGRATIVAAENEPQEARLARPRERGGDGLDALWNDDFHHSARVALTGNTEGYYGDHLGAPQELISAVKWGFLFQGQRYAWQDKRRGSPAFDLPPSAFVAYLENHDQVANSGRGGRLHQLTSPDRYRAMSALLLLAPSTPLLFQGQEFASSSPFVYFADHKAEIAGAVRRGRHQFLRQFPSLATPEMDACFADPGAPATFERCKLDLGERARHGETLALYRDLLRLRREERPFAAQRPRGVDGAVLGDEAFVLRFFGDDGDDRLLVVNLGRALRLEPAPEPLLAPPMDRRWAIRLSTDDPRYGGGGTPPLERDGRWAIPGHVAVVLHPVPAPPGGGAPGRGE